MHGFCSNKVILPFLLLAISETKFITAVKNKYCDHQDIETNIINTLNCWTDDAINFLGNMTDLVASDQEISCKEIVNVESCFTDNIGKCLHGELTTDIAAFLKLDSDMANYFVPMLIHQMTQNTQPLKNCDKGQNAFELVNKTIHEMIEKYEKKIKDGNTQELMDSIPMPDNDCSMEDLGKALEEYGPCLKLDEAMGNKDEHGHSNLVQKITRMVNPSNRNSGKPMTDDNSGGIEYPGCKMVTDAFNCMKPNKCISKDEMGMLKKLVATMYKNAKKITEKVEQCFKKLETRFNSVMKGDKQMEETKQFAEKQVNEAMKDSQVI